MSALREIAAFSLDSLGPLELYNLTLDGDRVLAGTCDLRKEERPGFLWCEPSGSIVHSQLLPASLDLIPSLDGYSWPFAMRGQSIAVMVGENRGIERSALCLLGHDGVWQVSRKTEVLGYSEGASHFVHLNEEGPQSELVIVSLELARPYQRVPFVNSRPTAIAVSPALTHLAVADRSGLVCSRLHGAMECSWPTGGSNIRRLWFAEDDLAIIGLRSKSVTLHQWGGGVQEFSVPNMWAKSFEPSTRSALFSNADEYVELDLSSGGVRSSGPSFGFNTMDVDLKRRRIATYKHGDGIRVFQMP